MSIIEADFYFVFHTFIIPVIQKIIDQTSSSSSSFSIFIVSIATSNLLKKIRRRKIERKQRTLFMIFYLRLDSLASMTIQEKMKMVISAFIGLVGLGPASRVFTFHLLDKPSNNNNQNINMPPYDLVF